MKTTANRNPASFYILFFFLLSLLGWLWEGALYLFTEHSFINRGVLIGPWLPIYGSGGILLTLLLIRCRRHPVSIFLISAVVCSALEYLTSWALEYAWGIRWWDYSSHFLNVNGRICLFGSIGFGLGGILIIYFLYPAFQKLYTRLTVKIRIFLVIILLMCFIPDCIHALFSPQTGHGVATAEETLYTFCYHFFHI